MSTILQISHSDCVGCGACYNSCQQQAIQLTTDNEGFYYPRINPDLCVDCGLCLRSCPVHSQGFHDMIEVYAITMKDNHIKRKSSSGGAFYWIASYFIEKGGVVYGAAFDPKKRRVEHIRIDSKNQLWRLQSSKYVQSYIGNTYSLAKKDLSVGKLVLFSGTPCQIAGVYSYLGHPYSNIYTCDILCYGVPSPYVFGKYLDEIAGDKQIITLNMRDKTDGWAAYSMKISMDAQEYFKGKYEDLYHLGFQSHIFYRESCYSCEFRRRERVGDFTLGDFWNFKESFRKNSIRNDETGISYVAINTENAKKIFEQLNKKDVYLEKRELDDNKDNYGFKRDMKSIPEREKFFYRLKENKYSEAILPYIEKRVQRKPSLLKKIYRGLKKHYYFRMILNKLGVGL